MLWRKRKKCGRPYTGYFNSCREFRFFWTKEKPLERLYFILIISCTVEKRYGESSKRGVEDHFEATVVVLVVWPSSSEGG